jgi:predicted ester cyclase
MDIDSTRRIAEGYLLHHDLSFLADDVLYTNTATGEELRGRDAVEGLLHFFYEEVFDAEATDHRLLVSQGQAAAEFRFRGKHVGEFAGIAATGVVVDVPVCVVLDIAERGVTGGRLYLPLERLLGQLRTHT